MTDSENGKKEEQGPTIPYPEFTGEGEKKELILPVGSFDHQNVFYRKVLYGPLTGTVRKKFSKPAILNNPGKLVTAVLTEILEFPHDLKMAPDDKKNTVRAMYSADRAWCIFAVRSATSNQAMVQKIKCPYCDGRLEIHTKPEECQLYKIEETDFVLKQGDIDYHLSHKTSWGPVVKFVLARGFAEEELTQNISQNIGEAAYSILASVVSSIDDKPVDPTIFDTWSTGKSDELFEVFSENQPGPETLLEVECIHCQRDVEFGVDPADFLLPSVRRKRFKRAGRKSAS